MPHKRTHSFLRHSEPLNVRLSVRRFRGAHGLLRAVRWPRIFSLQPAFSVQAKSQNDGKPFILAPKLRARNEGQPAALQMQGEIQVPCPYL